MKLKVPIFFSLAVVGLFIAAFYPPIDNAEKEAVLMHSILTGLNYYHYQPQEINDDFSAEVYDLYLDRLDGGRRWLTQQDVKQLEAFKYQIDDEANAGTYEFLSLSIRLINAGIDKTQAYYREFLSKPFDFSKDETIEVNGEKMSFAENDASLKEYWRKMMKYQTMTRMEEKLEKKEKGEEEFKDKTLAQLEEDARKGVLKTWDEWYNRLHKRKRTDFLSTYLNAITNIFDPHTGYFEPIDKQNFDISMSGRLEGIGARLQTDGDFTKVTEVVVGGPAWKEGELEKDDKILKVTQGEGEEKDITGMVLNDVVQLIRGKPGTKVTLQVKKQDGTTKDITITRDVVILEEGFAKSLLLETAGKEKIGYIRLPRFYADFRNPKGRFCSSDIAVELEKLQAENVNGIILDLRNNGGGSLRDVVKMSGFFIEEGPIVQVKSRGRKPEVLEDEDPSVQYDGPLIVMVNSFSASASEILAAALQDYGRAIIVGTGNSTFGKGTVQRFFDLDRTVRGNSQLKPLGEIKLTVQKFYRVNGGSTQLKGVTPDIILPDSYFYLKTGEKEEDHPLKWTEIEPVRYKQNVFSLSNLDKIEGLSAARVQNDEVFQSILEDAKRRKKVQDDSEYPLNLEVFQKEEKQLEKEGEAFKKLFDKEVVAGVINPEVDLAGIEADESKKARNEDWIKNVKKDVYLAETLNIMRDMLHLQ